METTVEFNHVRPLQVIWLASGVTVVAFLCVMAAVTSMGVVPPGETRPGESSIGVLSLVHALMAMVIYATAPMIFRRMGTMRATSGGSGLGPLPVASRTELTLRLRTAMIVRLAMMESVALFGITICLIGGPSGELLAQPLYWINLSSVAIFIVFLAVTFPTPDRLEYRLREMTTAFAGEPTV